MWKKAVSGIMFGLLLMGIFALAFNVQIVKSEPGTITVPDDYPTIQEAINAANEGDTLFVRNGTYYENVVLNKTLSLIGENRSTTIIDGNNTGSVIWVTTPATISGFTIRNARYSGIFVEEKVDGNNISGNIVENNLYGIWLASSIGSTLNDNIVSNCWLGIEIGEGSANTVSGNIVSHANQGIDIAFCFSSRIENNLVHNNNYGITLYLSRRNIIRANIILNNTLGIDLCWYSNNNSIFHNNFLGNEKQARSCVSINKLDDGYPGGGNYWSDYNGSDSYFGPYQNLTGSDGIGDVPYVIDENNVDNYPLVSPYEYWSNPILGDVNRDKKVSMSDIVQICDGFGSVNSSEGYYWHTPSCTLCPHCFNLDIDKNNKIGMDDIIIAVENFGMVHRP
ncbi:MAG: right-handed parallel beta-helix repeat-containing protein [Candidatus Bathyarchaeota archaeon]|nr:right-handed parallel beta-helix repeat-containing protein [Candidatus Bathyarchaeota archaeon]